MARSRPTRAWRKARSCPASAGTDASRARRSSITGPRSPDPRGGERARSFFPRRERSGEELQTEEEPVQPRGEVADTEDPPGDEDLPEDQIRGAEQGSCSRTGQVPGADRGR